MWLSHHQRSKNSVVPRSNAPSGLECIERFDISWLFHMTHIKNLPSIMKHGLLSHNLAHLRYQPIDISNREVNDRRAHRRDSIYHRNLHDYVPLYFRSKNPMSSFLRDIADDLVVLKFSRRLLLESGIVFTDGNAANWDTRFFNQLKHLNQLNWDCLNANYWTDFDDGKRQRCAEVLVHRVISAKAIQQIAVKNANTHKNALNFVTDKVPVITQPELFF